MNPFHLYEVVWSDRFGLCAIVETEREYEGEMFLFCAYESATFLYYPDGKGRNHDDRIHHLSELKGLDCVELKEAVTAK